MSLVPFHEIGQWYVPFILIAMIVTIMLSPVNRYMRYSSYRRPLYVIGTVAETFIFVPGFIMLLAPAGPVRFYSFFISIGVFWLLTIILASRRVIGKFVPEIANFRPDLMYPSGAMLARGEIFAGLSLKVLLTGTLIAGFGTSPAFGPVWSWWGLAWVFYSMIFLIAIRGMYKMKVRLTRMFHNRRTGLIYWIIEDSILWTGFSMLSYGFLNVFMGNIPFQYVTPAYPMIKTLFLPGLIPLIISAVILVPVRAVYKSRRDSMTETLASALGAQVILYIEIIFLLYGWISLFMGAFLVPKITPGLYFFLIMAPLAAFLLIHSRAVALRNERRGMLANMLHFLSYEPIPVVKNVISKRLTLFASLPQERRVIALAEMSTALEELPPREKELLSNARFESLASVPEDVRSNIMEVMDRAMSLSQTGGREASSAVSHDPEVQTSAPHIPSFLRIPMFVNIGMGVVLLIYGSVEHAFGLDVIGIVGILLFIILIIIGAA